MATDHTAIEAIGVLRDLLAEERAALAEERAKIERLIEATTYWQSRANQAEEKLKMLTVGDVADDQPQPRTEPPSDPPAGQGEAIAVNVTPDVSQSAPVVDPPRWWEFWRR